MTIEVEEKVF
jgi:hypothetical protein